MTIAKVVSLEIFGYIVTYFISGKLQYIFGIVPTYWIGKSVITEMAAYYITAVLVNFIWLAALVKVFSKKVAK